MVPVSDLLLRKSDLHAVEVKMPEAGALAVTEGRACVKSRIAQRNDVRVDEAAEIIEQIKHVLHLKRLLGQGQLLLFHSQVKGEVIGLPELSFFRDVL